MNRIENSNKFNSPSLFEVPALIISNKRNSEQFNINRILLLSIRFMRFIEVSQFIRIKNYKKKVMIYFISLDEFTKNLGRIIQVTKRSKAFPLRISGGKQRIGRFYPTSSFATLSGAVINDNNVEVFSDYHLYLSSFKLLKSNIIRQLNSLFVSIVGLNQPHSIIFGDILNNQVNFKKSFALSLVTNKSNYNYLTPPYYTIFNDEKLVRKLYENALIFKYFF